jgi:hypothetical protein
MKNSRIANVIGNVLRKTERLEQVKAVFFADFVSRYADSRHFVSTDPLTAMMIPKQLIEQPNTHIVHVQRDHDEFARSMLLLTRRRWPSRIAHNLIPFWQPGLFPLENWLRKNVHERYRQVSIVKNQYFTSRYGMSPNYYHVTMKNLFSSGFLAELIAETLGESITISRDDLSKKANEF